MKMTTTTFLALFLLSSFTTYLPSAIAQDVLDTDGNILRNGGIYYLRPVIVTANGGGVEFAETGNETCPLTVVQNPSPFSKGSPVRISSLARIPWISQGLSLFIGFTFVPPCAPIPSEWTVVKGLGEEPSIKLTGYDNTERGGFQIKSVQVEIGGYNLLFCPEDGCACSYVAVNVQANRQRPLVVTKSEEAPLWIRFEKLSYASTATHEPPLTLKSHVLISFYLYFSLSHLIIFNI